ncbi:MAG TPA: sulfite oxidase-like oxidoreductase [Baekduia sp.]|uniref:sulfite oxidase-like oxidoreductase n=1 Tax=Baekduia sp. TaxID=2600305 RepID=UPI002D78E070|nr:sulfite oxidase-like oxidoreductase [Baekduia sp.]HET6507476.1 sulfite oxidase-like oxidoreductase [Baekduia sp.]
MANLTSKLFGERGRKRAIKLGLDPDRLPPGQSPTVKWPVLTVGPTPEVDTARWSLAFYGEVDHPYALRWEELAELERVSQVSDLHCVTRWSRFDQELSGFRVAPLLERAAPRPSATHALIHCYGGYSTNLPLSALRDEDVLIATHAGGAPLQREHGGPARLLVPSRYLWKSAKWVQSIELMDHDEPGFWERNGYHNDGDPWTEQRTHEDPYAFRAMRRRARGVDEPD